MSKKTESKAKPQDETDVESLVGQIAEETMIGDLMEVCLQEIRLGSDYETLGENDQRQIIDRVALGCRAAVRQAIRIIDSEGREHAVARVDYVKFKDGEAIAQLKGTAEENFHKIADAAGPVLLILSDDSLAGGGHEHKPDDKQSALDLEEGGSDE